MSDFAQNSLRRTAEKRTPVKRATFVYSAPGCGGTVAASLGEMSLHGLRRRLHGVKLRLSHKIKVASDSGSGLGIGGYVAVCAAQVLAAARTLPFYFPP
jgi:hypothetical protein